AFGDDHAGVFYAHAAKTGQVETGLDSDDVPLLQRAVEVAQRGCLVDLQADTVAGPVDHSGRGGIAREPVGRRAEAPLDQHLTNGPVDVTSIHPLAEQLDRPLQCLHTGLVHTPDFVRDLPGDYGPREVPVVVRRAALGEDVDDHGRAGPDRPGALEVGQRTFRGAGHDHLGGAVADLAERRLCTR